jgi:hypothetical protein
MKIKTIIIAGILLLIINKGISQHLTYNELLILQNSSVEKCEEILNKKGFVLSDTKYDEDSKETSINWKYKNVNNEYFTKTCSNLFSNNCTEIFYMTNNELSISTIKNNMKAGFNKFVYTDTNSKGVLSHHYLINAFKSLEITYPREVVFYTFPTSISEKKLFAIKIHKIDIKIVEE